MSKEFDMEQPIITLELDDDTVLECVVVSIFPVEENDYIALLPIDEMNNDEGELLIYRYAESDEGEPLLTNIETDEEYDAVAEVLENILVEMEFDDEFEALGGDAGSIMEDWDIGTEENREDADVQ